MKCLVIWSQGWASSSGAMFTNHQMLMAFGIDAPHSTRILVKHIAIAITTIVMGNGMLSIESTVAIIITLVMFYSGVVATLTASTSYNDVYISKRTRITYVYIILYIHT